VSPAAVVSGKSRRIGDEEGRNISIAPPWKGCTTMQATGALGHPTLGASRSYQGMKGHNEATTGAIAIIVIGTNSPTKTMERDVSNGDLSGLVHTACLCTVSGYAMCSGTRYS
jgi:hypothetical protein